MLLQMATLLVLTQEQAAQRTQPWQRGRAGADAGRPSCCSARRGVPDHDQDQEGVRVGHRLSSAHAAARQPLQHRCASASQRMPYRHASGLNLGQCTYSVMARPAHYVMALCSDVSGIAHSLEGLMPSAGFVALRREFAGFERGSCVSMHCEAPHLGRLEGISLRLAEAGAICRQRETLQYPTGHNASFLSVQPPAGTSLGHPVAPAPQPQGRLFCDLILSSMRQENTTCGCRRR